MRLVSPVASLGASTALLYEELGAIVERASAAGSSARASRLATARISLAILCGTYHDTRSGSVDPKGDLVEALRAVPMHRSIDGEIAALVGRVLRGEFTDGAGVPRVARVTHHRPQDTTPEPIELSHREWRAFVWLYRYVEVYGLAPLLREMAAGLDTTTIIAAGVMRVLERKGAVAGLGGRRGWLPLRSP